MYYKVIGIVEKPLSIKQHIILLSLLRKNSMGSLNVMAIRHGTLTPKMSSRPSKSCASVNSGASLYPRSCLQRRRSASCPTPLSHSQQPLGTHGLRSPSWIGTSLHSGTVQAGRQAGRQAGTFGSVALPHACLRRREIWIFGCEVRTPPTPTEGFEEPRLTLAGSHAGILSRYVIR